MKIVIDMMGGDNGVKATIPALLDFVKLHEDIYVYAVEIGRAHV